MRKRLGLRTRLSGAVHPDDSLGSPYIRAVFDTFDVDDSGTIDPIELSAALSALGLHTKSEDGANSPRPGVISHMQAARHLTLVSRRHRAQLGGFSRSSTGGLAALST